MKQTLGKILFLIFCAVNLIASSVNLRVDSPAIYKGDIASFTITANSSNVDFPDIQDIEDFNILGKSSSSSTSIINGNYSKKVSTTYSFRPTKDVTIPSFSVKVDGNTLQTKPKKISVIKPTKSKNGDKFVVELKVDNTTLKVGQSTQLTIIFKRRLDAKVDKLNLNEPKIENFWIKPIDGSKQYTKGQYIVQEISYMIFAQKAGKFTIDPIEIDVGKVNRNSYSSFFNNSLRWSKIYSNNLTINVEALPNNMELYGDFTIDTIVDKTTIDANKPVNVTIKIAGAGNIDDIQKFDPTIKDTVIYADKPTIKANIVNGKYQGSFIQKIACIGDSDFTIPSFKLSYFDKNTQKIKTIQTKPIDIKLNSSSKKVEIPTIEKLQKNTAKTIKQNVKIVKEDSTLKYIYLALGVLLGGIVTYIFLKLKAKEKPKKENDIIVAIKKAKDDKTLFNILLPYAKEDVEIDNILHQLEENIYKSGQNKIDKKKVYFHFI